MRRLANSLSASPARQVAMCEHGFKRCGSRTACRNGAQRACRSLRYSSGFWARCSAFDPRKNLIRQAATHRVDDLSINLYYLNRMRRVWLTVLMAFALAASGVVNAAAAPSCPMQVSAGSPSQHDCCDENGAPSKSGSDKMSSCMEGMACRSAPTVAPVLAPLLAPSATVRVSQPILGEPAAPSGPLQQLFRPPRSI